MASTCTGASAQLRTACVRWLDSRTAARSRSSCCRPGNCPPDGSVPSIRPAAISTGPTRGTRPYSSQRSRPPTDLGRSCRQSLCTRTRTASGLAHFTDAKYTRALSRKPTPSPRRLPAQTRWADGISPARARPGKLPRLRAARDRSIRRRRTGPLARAGMARGNRQTRDTPRRRVSGWGCRSARSCAFGTNSGRRRRRPCGPKVLADPLIRAGQQAPWRCRSLGRADSRRIAGVAAHAGGTGAASAGHAVDRRLPDCR